MNDEMELYRTYRTLSALPSEYLEPIQEVEEPKKVKKGKTWYSQIHRPRIETNGFIFKKTTIYWDCIPFGTYPQSKALRLKKQMKEKLFEDANGDFIYKEENASGLTLEKYRKVSRSYFKYEPIRWRVLSVRNGIALLLADVILDSKPYQEGNEDTAWKKCSLREWMNSKEGKSFYTLAFSEEEKKAIVEKDEMISLLNNADVRERRGICEVYNNGKLSLDDSNEKNFSDYAEEMRLSILKKTYAGERMGMSAGWWLKPTGSQTVINFVSEYGYVKSHKPSAASIVMGFRPIVWVDLSKLERREITNASCGS